MEDVEGDMEDVACGHSLDCCNTSTFVQKLCQSSGLKASEAVRPGSCHRSCLPYLSDPVCAFCMPPCVCCKDNNRQCIWQKYAASRMMLHRRQVYSISLSPSSSPNVMLYSTTYAMLACLHVAAHTEEAAIVVFSHTSALINQKSMTLKSCDKAN